MIYIYIYNLELDDLKNVLINKNYLNNINDIFEILNKKFWKILYF